MRRILLMALALAGRAAVAADEAAIPGPDGVTLRALVVAPDAPSRPAVIALHGCGGGWCRSSSRGSHDAAWGTARRRRARTPAMIVALGSDHAGLPLKQALLSALEARGHAVLDAGTHGTESCDYPDFAHAACAKVLAGEARFAVLVCGSGIGMAIAANRHAGIRAAVLHSSTEARLTRAHNDANVACFGARTTGVELALDALDAFLSTEFEGGRHQRRLDKLSPVAIA